MSNNTNQAPQQWNSRFGYIMVAPELQSASGNIWKFPYLASPRRRWNLPDRLHNCYCINGTPDGRDGNRNRSPQRF